MSDDYYNILGVERSATTEDIKRAYRKLAHRYHPDKAGGDEEKFKQVNAAYQVLSDDAKRARYDQFGEAHESAGAGPFGGFGGFRVDMDDLGGIGDIFEQFFGHSTSSSWSRGGGRARSARQQVRRGADVAIDATVSFVESARGVTKEVSLRLQQTCSHCHGNGAEPGTPIVDCPTCHGRGSVSATRQTMLGTFTQATVCPRCRGEGKEAKKPCRRCRGEGREMTDRALDVSIPAGIADGQTIRLSGKGEAAARGGVPGDLFVNIHVTPHPTLRRDGDDVRSNLAISFADAALGTTENVATLEGSRQLTVPAGTQPDSEIRLAGLGFPHLQGGGRGDHRVTVNVEIPRKLSRQQRVLLEQFKSAKKRGLFG